MTGRAVRHLLGALVVGASGAGVALSTTVNNAPPPTAAIFQSTGTAAAASASATAAASGPDMSGVFEECYTDWMGVCRATGIIDVVDAVTHRRVVNFSPCAVSMINKRVGITAKHCFRPTPNINFNGGACTYAGNHDCVAKLWLEGVGVVQPMVQIDAQSRDIVLVRSPVAANTYARFELNQPSPQQSDAPEISAVGLNVPPDADVSLGELRIAVTKCQPRPGPPPYFRCATSAGYSGGPIVDKSGRFFAMTRGEDGHGHTLIVAPSDVTDAFTEFKSMIAAPTVTAGPGYLAVVEPNVFCQRAQDASPLACLPPDCARESGSYRCWIDTNEHVSLSTLVTIANAPLGRDGGAGVEMPLAIPAADASAADGGLASMP